MNKRNQKKKKHQSIPVANRKYKDTLFRLAFANKSDLLALYNAVNHTEYQNADDLEVNTLEDAVYLSMKNDLSFLIGGTMNLYEHQSSYNPNQPIRGLIYFAKLYEWYTQENGLNLYSSALKKLPVPRYVVFYNGTKEEPDEMVLKLTDAFCQVTDGKEPCLECTATMLNINYGHNRELMEKCRRLEEYAYFVRAVRQHIRGSRNLNMAITAAVNECIEQGKLKDILMKNKTEVIGMILTSFKDENYYRMMEAEWKESGLAKGREEGLKEGIKEGRKEGIKEGIKEGRKEGLKYKLLELICKKLRKGKTPEAIAAELEEEYSFIAGVCERAEELAPEYDCERLYAMLYGEGQDAGQVHQGETR